MQHEVVERLADGGDHLDLEILPVPSLGLGRDQLARGGDGTEDDIAVFEDAKDGHTNLALLGVVALT